MILFSSWLSRFPYLRKTQEISLYSYEENTMTGFKFPRSNKAEPAAEIDPGYKKLIMSRG